MDQNGYQYPYDNKNRLREIILVGWVTCYPRGLLIEIADFSDTSVVEYAYDPLVLQRYVGLVRP